MTIVAVYNIVIIEHWVGGMARAFTFHSTLDCILHRIFLWVEFVGSLLSSEAFSPGSLVFLTA